MVSPLLANVYLHYAIDLWAERWRRREATGDMIIVRYADDIVIGFERETDAQRFWEAMRERLREFSLSLHPEELSPNFGDGLRIQAAAVWAFEDAGLTATSIPSVNLTP